MDVLIWEGLIAAAGVGANAVTVAYMLGRKTAKFEAGFAAVTKDLLEHTKRMDAQDSRLNSNEGKFDRHEGRIVRLTVSGAQLATALAVKLTNPHPDPIFQKVAESYERIHGGSIEREAEA